MNSHQKIGTLAGAHAAAGIAVMLVRAFTDITWPRVMEVVFAAFIASELTAVLLAARQLTQRFENEWYLVGLAIIFPLEVVLATGSLVWAGLGHGQLRVRVPIALLFTGLVGFLLPFFLGGPDIWIWPAMSFFAGLFTLASLVVVRSAGYRMVRVRANRDEAVASLQSVADCNVNT